MHLIKRLINYIKRREAIAKITKAMKFEKTSDAHPEQYILYLWDYPAAYVRLRGGLFCVCYTPNGELDAYSHTLYLKDFGVSTIGCFTNKLSRAWYLRKAKFVLASHVLADAVADSR